MPRILALDLGKKRVGVAVSDALGMTAQGLPTYTRQNRRADLEHFTNLIREYGVERAIVGLPLHMSGDNGRQAEHARHFAESLSRHSGVKTGLWDERLTTVEASRVLRESGISLEKRKQAVDRLSAVLILQSYLDSPAQAAATASPARS
jgi:putative Holliday junction resolvase